MTRDGSRALTGKRAVKELYVRAEIERRLWQRPPLVSPITGLLRGEQRHRESSEHMRQWKPVCGMRNACRILASHIG